MSEPVKVALAQLNARGDWQVNLKQTEALIREAAAEGAVYVQTPEVTNLIAPSGEALMEALYPESSDPTLAALRKLADELDIHLHIGSLALKTEGPDADGRAINRGFLIGPDGGILSRYDKIHMFEADLGSKGRYRETARFRPGRKAVLADLPWGKLGLSICYDLRFPALYRALARKGADMLAVPAAFTVPTGQAHWHVLLRARAIETGCFVLAAAQWGPHGGTDESSLRESYGHSLIISPWGEILADAGEGPGLAVALLDREEVAKARARIPSLTTDADWRFEG